MKIKWKETTIEIIIIIFIMVTLFIAFLYGTSKSVWYSADSNYSTLMKKGN
jgi:hypothetical protein